jgi:hypothetical protein
MRTHVLDTLLRFSLLLFDVWFLAVYFYFAPKKPVEGWFLCKGRRGVGRLTFVVCVHAVTEGYQLMDDAAPTPLLPRLPAYRPQPPHLHSQPALSSRATTSPTHARQSAAAKNDLRVTLHQQSSNQPAADQPQPSPPASSSAAEPLLPQPSLQLMGSVRRQNSQDSMRYSSAEPLSASTLRSLVNVALDSV